MSTETPAQPRREYRGGNPALALILILLGVAFLLNNFGILGWNVWADLWRFWPVALILFGVQTIFGRTRLGSFMIFLVGLLFIGLIVIYSYLLPGSGYLTNNRTSITYTPPSSSPTYASQRIVKLHAE